MSSRGRFFRHWIPVVLWTLLIFYGSTDVGSERRTSRFIGPFLHWLVPGISDTAVDRIQYDIRKFGHVSEYAVLAILIGRALQPLRPEDRRRWSWRLALAAVALCALYACTDEYHQSFVASRYASVLDVFIDTAGAAVGIVALRGFRLWRRRG